MVLNNQELISLKEIISGAGAIVMNYFGKTVADYKEAQFDVVSIVTEADKACEEYLVQEIQRLFPTHGIIGEEGANINPGAEYVWYLDPVDGTANFDRQMSDFAVMAGLTRTGKPIFGAMYFPILELLVHAEEGQGTFVNDKRVHVSDRPLNKSLYFGGGWYRKELGIDSRLLEKIGLVKIVGASSYAAAQIAMGNAELYYLRGVPHDHVPGTIIIQEAGGKVTDIDGTPWTVHSKKIVATNGKIHEEVLNILQSS